MSIQVPTAAAEIEYPDDDGQPMADNTLQFQWIVTIQGNLAGLFQHDVNVFVAGNLLWYPVEGQPLIRNAPDVMVIFGRPKVYRGSYMQWHEEGIGPQVVFEVLSPGNRPAEMDRKFEFYNRYGVEEYYLYDPDHPTLCGWVREGGRLRPIPYRDGWVSPRLRIRFDLSGEEMVIYHPDGRRFLTFVELVQQQQEAQRRIDEALRRAEQLAERLRALGIDPDQIPGG